MTVLIVCLRIAMAMRKLSVKMKIIFMVIQIQKVLKNHVKIFNISYQNWMNSSIIFIIKDEFKPHILGMCETFLNEEKCKKNSRKLVN
jgi:hypothetical protein